MELNLTLSISKLSFLSKHVLSHISSFLSEGHMSSLSEKPDPLDSSRLPLILFITLQSQLLIKMKSLD